MHKHSLEAYREGRPALSRRALAVLEWIRKNGPATDREVMRGLGYTDPNATRPRVTELVGGGVLREVGKTRDPQTGKTVRIVATPQEQLELIAPDAPGPKISAVR